MDYPKFILTSRSCLRLGMVHLHKDLLEPGEQCYGGGYYEFDHVAGRLLLTGQSYDFGPPRWDWLSRIKAPASLRGLEIVYRSGHSWDDDFCVSGEMEIEYV